MNCTICGLPTGNIVGSVLPQCKCGWQAPQPPKAQRQWVGLTEKERLNLAVDLGAMSADWIPFMEAVEAKLKEKNT